MSVSNLITSIDQLRVGDGISKIESRQIPPDRVVSGTNFKDGDLHFRFTVGGNNWFIPSKSYLSMRTTIASAGTTQPTLASDMAPAPGYASCFWSGCELRIADTPVSRITNNVAQIDAVRTRLMKSKNWIDTVGKSTNFWDHSYVSRQHSVVSNAISDDKRLKYVDLTGASVTILGASPFTEANPNTIQANAGRLTGVGTLFNNELAAGDIIVVNGIRYHVATVVDNLNITVQPVPATNIAPTNDFHLEITTHEPALQQHNVIESVWQPPLGVFDVDHPLPPGDYDLVLSPNTSNYNASAIQVEGGVIGAKNVTMQNLYFNVAVIEASNIPEDFTYYLDLKETSVQLRPLTSVSNDEQTLDFTVAPTTFALSYATQEVGSGTNPIYPPTLFKSGDLQERNLKRLRLNYAGQTQPINETLDYSTATDYMTKLYTDTLMNSNAYADTHGVGESKADWVARGPLAHYRFSKPSNDGSTRVNLQVTLNTTSTTNAMLFSHFKNVAKISYRNKRVESVSVDYA